MVKSTFRFCFSFGQSIGLLFWLYQLSTHTNNRVHTGLPSYDWETSVQLAQHLTFFILSVSPVKLIFVCTVSLISAVFVITPLFFGRNLIYFRFNDFSNSRYSLNMLETYISYEQVVDKIRSLKSYWILKFSKGIMVVNGEGLSKKQRSRKIFEEIV